MKKNLVFLAGLLFLLAVEIYVVYDSWGSRRPAPVPTAATPRPSP